MKLEFLAFECCQSPEVREKEEQKTPACLRFNSSFLHMFELSGNNELVGGKTPEPELGGGCCG